MESRPRSFPEKLLLSSDARMTVLKGPAAEPYGYLSFVFPFFFSLIFFVFPLYVIYMILDSLLGMDKVWIIMTNFWFLPVSIEQKLSMFLKFIWFASFFLCFFIPFVFTGFVMAYASASEFLKGINFLKEHVNLEARENWILVHYSKKTEMHLWKQITDFQVTDRNSGNMMLYLESGTVLNITGFRQFSSLEKIIAEKLKPNP